MRTRTRMREPTNKSDRGTARLAGVRSFATSWAHFASTSRGRHLRARPFYYFSLYMNCDIAQAGRAANIALCVGTPTHKAGRRASRARNMKPAGLRGRRTRTGANEPSSNVCGVRGAHKAPSARPIEMQIMALRQLSCSHWWPACACARGPDDNSRSSGRLARRDQVQREHSSLTGAPA